MNYFKAAGALHARKEIDEQLFFGFLAPQVIRTFEMFQDLNRTAGQPTIKFGLGEFAEAAEKFFKAQQKALGIESDAPST